ncbi:hypothetical protein [Actinomadura rubrisoli]|uniref:Uncharacterized protein n=1 Tax=Actinomadura rubrisoli TaxID=2530368 RepID=A0A4R5C3L4_9ACTN|nr:hypothetical protein [Actinomadura rubrisoli]TDD93495.1 hypothetical protein E1298_09205 [Actinomadura rubrisoli]
MSGSETQCGLMKEFPGWLVEVKDVSGGTGWHAWRPASPGRGGFFGAQADELGLLRELLDEADGADARLALRDLAVELRECGITATAYDTTLTATGPGGRTRLVTCRRGLFRWLGGGRVIGPVGDPLVTVDAILAAFEERP